MNSVYHAGELAVQKRAGVSEMARRVGNGIHSEIPPAAQDFLEQQPFVIVGSVGANGDVWASLLSGEPGFVHILDEQTVQIEAAPALGDPLAEILADTQSVHEVGLLAIEPETRRRMRLNGTAELLGNGALRVHAREVYANCPKYIQARTIELNSEKDASIPQVRHTITLSPEQRAWIANADTFFIASAAPHGGADASHRGGNPGFVRVINETTLEFPDYSGNTMFNTLGNITANPHAGLLFLDFENGETLQLTGTAEVIWEPERAVAFPGAERVVEFHLVHTIHITPAHPLHFHFLDYSRFNPQ